MKLTTKLLLAFVLTAIIPIFVFNYLNYRHTKQALKNGMLDNLIFTAEAQEGFIYNFLDAIKNRAIDFSSDGFLRKGVEEMRKLDANDVRYTRLRKALIAHLRLNKKPLDKSIRGICIVDLKGKIIASTDRHNVNRDISMSAYFKQGQRGACVSDVYPSYCCAATKYPYQISVAAPLMDKRTKTIYAIIVNCYSSNVLNKILSGQQQLGSGAISGSLGRRETLDTYLINREKLLITPSKYSNEVMKRRVETLLVVEAAAGKETSGIYKNYLGVEVIGASMYFPSNGWTLCVEMSTSEVLIPLAAMRNRIIILGIPIGALIIFLAYLFSKRTHGALREAEDKLNILSQVVEQGPASIVVTDTKGNIEYVNKKFTTLTEYAIDEVIGKNPRILKSGETPVEEYKRLWDTITSGGVWRGELHNKKKSGETYWEYAVISPVRNMEGNIINFVGINEDIGDRKQAERRLSAQHTMTQILVEAASIAEASPKILQTICECLEWDIGELWMMDSGSNVLCLAESWHLPSVKAPEFEAMSREITFSPGVGLPGRVWASGKPFWISDVTKDANFPRIAVAAKEGLHGAFGFPIMVKGEILGVMDFFSCKIRQPDDDLLNMIAAIGRQIGLFVKRRQSDEISKRTELEYKTVISTAMDGFWFTDTEGRLLDVNDASCRLSGYSREELLTMRIQDIEDKETQEVAVQHIKKIMESGYDRFETRHRCKDGKIVDVEVSVNYVKITGGRFFVFLRDITERKKSDAQIRLQLQRLAVISNIDKAILSTLDLRVVLEVFMDKAFPQLHVDAADILLFNPYMQTLEYVVGRGFHTSAVQCTQVRLGEGCCGRAAVERHPVFVRNLREESCVRSKQLSIEESFVSYCAAPLIAKGQVNGVLEVFRRAPFDPDQEWVGFLETLAGQAAIAIDNAELFEGLQHANTELVQAYDATIEGWSHALDLRDKETEGHSQRVTEMTVLMAASMGVSKSDLIHVRRGSLLHDIGKMGVPDNILLKIDKLTDEEWIIIRKHPVYAHEMLSPIAYLRPALDIPYCHHEKWDGTGYPRGLKGEQIPLIARIFAVVDVWDAMRSDRPYRKGWADEKVREHIKSLTGTHFDPKVVEVFLK